MAVVIILLNNMDVFGRACSFTY